MAETAQMPVDPPATLPMTTATQERKIHVRWSDPPPDRVSRVVRLSRLPLAALTWIVLGLVVVGSVLAWLVIVPLLDFAAESFGRTRRLLGRR